MKKKKLTSLLFELENILDKIERESFYVKELSIAEEKFLSALNLIDYLTFRNFELAELQERLGELGLTRFARAEAHIRHSIKLNLKTIRLLLATDEHTFVAEGISVKKSRKTLSRNTQNIFGKKLKEKRVRTMVTMPTDAAFEPHLINSLIENKMNCARINCAHDDKEIWIKIVENLKNSASTNDRTLKIAADLSGPKIRTGTLFQNGKKLKVGKKQFLTLYDSDELLLLKAEECYGENENRKAVTCTLPDVLDMTKVGERIFFDDGKIEGVVKEKESDQNVIRIIKTKLNGSKLKPEKGINLPDSNLQLPGLTAKDKEDFDFVVNYCDIVNLSFVNTIRDLEDLYNLIDKYDAQHLSILLKIETKSAFNNLPQILLQSMSRQTNLGVMIARGDLAVEVGWENIGHVQNEIIRICAAAHIPVVWATQVLESMAKKGIPSRSEVTDISQALKADCVMLNKGPYIVEALQFLNKILIKDEAFQQKADAMLPKLENV